MILVSQRLISPVTIYVVGNIAAAQTDVRNMSFIPNGSKTLC